MKLRAHVLLVAICFFQVGYGQNMVAARAKYVAPPAEKIIILADVPKNYGSDTITLEMVSAKYKKGAEWIKKEGKVENGKVKWVIENNKPLMILSPGYYTMFEPGDSIAITYNVVGQPQYSGKGAEKYDLIERVESIKKTIPAPTAPQSRYHNTLSLQDYIDWMAYLDKQLEMMEPLIETYKSKLSPFAFNFCKSSIIGNIEFERLQKYQSLMHRAKSFGVTTAQLAALYDTIAAQASTKWLASLSEASPEVYYYYHFLRVTHARKFNFDYSHDSLANEANRKIAYYSLAKNTFKDETLESLLSYILIDACFNEIGFPPQVEMLLNDFYARPGYAEYKEHVNRMEKKYRASLVAKGQKIPVFQILNDQGNSHNNTSVRGKITLLSFQAGDCKDCAKNRIALEKVQQEFSNTADVKIVFIQANESNKATRKQFNVVEYPTLCVIDPDGRFLVNPNIGHVDNIGAEATATIKQQLTLLHDGPYVFTGTPVTTAININSDEVETVKPSKNEGQLKTLSAQTDMYNKQFNFKLKTKHEVEPCVFDKPAKLFAISDIEGSFDALRKLLQGNKVIDNEFNWIYGNGHLVLNGDMFDRGKQVTECLWLIYSLEEKAKAAGGYVHFILGNHEIMNLNGDTRYVQRKYLENAKKMGKEYIELYNAQTELGAWLRTKNIMEKIGDLLFVHGGISSQVNQLSLDLKGINNAAKAWYDKDSIARTSKDNVISALFDQENSPFWYRLYYVDQEVKVLSNFDTIYKAPAAQIDLTLAKFGVSHIVTGHTITSSSVNTHYDGKVINIDTPHKGGKSEGLLVEGEKFYRVNTSGQKFPLMGDKVAAK